MDIVAQITHDCSACFGCWKCQIPIHGLELSNEVSVTTLLLYTPPDFLFSFSSIIRLKIFSFLFYYIYIYLNIYIFKDTLHLFLSIVRV
jgi:hypothetical protein